MTSLAVRRALVSGLALALTAAATASAADTPEPVARVVVDEAERGALGLATASVTAAHDAGTLSANGRVLDPVPLVDAVTVRATARSAATRAQQESERVRRLARGQENASTRELEMAEDAQRQARIARDAADARLAAAFGAALSDRPDLETLAGRLARGEVALGRVDVPPGDLAAGMPSEIQLFDPNGGERPLAAALLGPAPVVDLMVQGRGWLVLIDRSPPPVGAALTAQLTFPERAAEGFLVPREALLRQAGRVWAYVQVAPDTFERRELALILPRPDGWLATGSLAAGDLIVVRGAQELLAKELVPATAGAAQD